MQTAAIEAEIELREELVARLAALERHQREIGRLRRELDAPRAMQRLQQELDRAAFAAMLRAEKTYRLDNRPQEATVYYRQVLRLYFVVVHECVVGGRPRYRHKVVLHPATDLNGRGRGHGEQVTE